jgi:hypothetical protein
MSANFLEEVGLSFAIPHEEEYFGGFSSADLVTACGDLALKNFVASQCLARKLDREAKEAKELSAVVTASLQKRVTELEKRLAVEQSRNQQEKENEAKTSQATLEMLRLDLEKVASAKEDLSVQLRNKNTELAEAKTETDRLNGVLERYRTEHIQCAEVLAPRCWNCWGNATLTPRPLRSLVHSRVFL